MDHSFLVTQVTGAIPGANPTAINIVKLTKPDTNQAVTIPLDGTVQIDLSSIANVPVTFVHVGDELVILFDNKATVALEPFFGSDGTPLPNITVELTADRSVSGAEFASLFPITSDQSVLPAAGNATPASGADFQTVTIEQLVNTATALGLLGPESPNGNAPEPNGNVNTAFNLTVQGPTLTLHDAAGSEDKPIALNITEALSIADPRTSLANITITEIPAGVHFNQGTLSADGKTLTLTPAQLAGLTLTSDGAQHFTLTVTATTTEGAVTATSTATLNVDVTPVADAPVLNVSNASGNEDHAIALNIQPALAEADADAAITSVKITGVPAGAVLSAGTHNDDGSWTLTPAQLSGLTLTSDGEVQHFALTVTATAVDGGNTATSTATFSVKVTPVADAPVLTVGTFGPTLFFPDQSDQQGAFLKQAAINDAGTIVGTIDRKDSSIHGFELPPGATTGTFLNFTRTIEALGINSSGTIVGDLTNALGKMRGFVLTPDGGLTTINFPDHNSVSTSIVAINDSGVIAGNASVNGEGLVGFVDRGNVFTTINIEGLGTTHVSGIDNAGDIVGSFSTDLFHVHGFILLAGQTTPTIVDVPGATVTAITGISSDASIIVGSFGINGGFQHGFTDRGGIITTFDLPGSSPTLPTGVNDAGQIVGTFGNVGFEATLPANEDKPIALGIRAALSEVDPDAVLTVTITGIPSGVTFSAGTLSADGKSLTLTPDQLANLSLTSDGEVQHFDLTVTATTVDGGDTATAASTTKTLHIDVTPVADAPVLVISSGAPEGGQGGGHDGGEPSVSGNEDTPIALPIKAALSEADADAVLAVTISGIPTGATLSDNGSLLTTTNGSVSLTDSQITDLNNGLITLTSDGEVRQFDLTVTATTNEGSSVASVTKDMNVAVNPVAEAPILDLPLNTRPVDVPNALPTFASGINNSETIVGDFFDQTGNTHGFVDRGGAPVTLDAPNSTFTEATSINDAGDVVGFFDDRSGNEHGFTIDHAGTFTQIDFTDSKGNVAPITEVLGINGSGEVVGTFTDSNNHTHGFSEQGGVFTQIAVPGAKATFAFGVNDGGEIVGIFNDAAGHRHGFLQDTNGAVTVIDVPGATLTQARGIDDNGDIVGVFDDAAGRHGFSRDPSGHFTTIDVPGSAETDVLGLNDVGEEVGLFRDGQGKLHGFVAGGGVSGAEDNPIALGITAALGEVDPDAVLSVVITNIPSGVTFSAGTLSADGKTLTLTPVQLAGLTLTSDGEVQHFDLRVTATTVDGGDTATAASTTKTLHVDVTPVADAPIGFETTIAGIGVEDKPIALGIQAAPSEADHDAVLTVTIAGVPIGASLNHGSIVAIDPSGNTTWSVDAADLPTLALTSDGEVQHFDLTVTATTVDGGDAATAASSPGQTLHIDVSPVTDAPVVAVTNASGNEDQPIALDIQPSLAQPDADAAITTITITGLPTSGVTLSDANGDKLATDAAGSISLTPAQLAGLTLTSDGERQHFDLTVTATAQDGDAVPASTSATLHVDVTPVADQPTLAFTSGIVPAPTESGISQPPAVAVSGNEETPIAFTMKAGLGEVDPDAVLSVTISGIPAGVTLNHGRITSTDANSVTTWSVDPADLSTLALTGDGEAQHFILTVTVTAVDGGDTARAASIVGTAHVDIAPVSDPPVLAAADVSAAPPTVALSGTGALSITPHFEADADATDTVTISGVPTGASLISGTTTFQGGNGPITLTADQLAGLELQAPSEDGGIITLSVQAHAQDAGVAVADSAIQTLSIAVAPPPPLLNVANASGTEDQAITLAIQSSLAAQPQPDPDETLTITITGIPSGVTFSTGTLSGDGKTLTLRPDELANLTLTGNGETQHFDLKVTATEQDGGVQAATSATLHVDVTPATAAPTFASTSATITAVEGSQVNIAPDISPIFAPPEAGETDVTNSITISGLPAGATITGGSVNGDGSVTVQQDHLAGPILLNVPDTDASFNLTVTATSNDGGVPATSAIPETITVHVNPQADAPPTPSIKTSTKTEFALVDVPFGDSTEVHGGNNFGVVVGDFTSGSRTLGFIDRGGQFIEISADFVGSNTVHAFGVNDAGTVVGTFVDPRNGSATEGFIETKNGADTVFSVHGAIETDARAIDSFGDVVGFFKDSNGAFHGFERFTNGDIFTFDTPFGGTNTRALGINDAGQIVGSLVLPGDPGFEETIGFIDTNGVFTLVAGPSTATPSFSEADGINNFGEVSGFSLSSTGKEQAFVGQIVEDAFGRVPVSINGNTVTTPFTPVGPVGINDSGQLFGSFQNGVTHGFVSSNVTGVFGVAGAATPVTINAFQSEVDPDATLTVTISNIPTGMTFNHGVTSDKGATVTLAQSDLAGLTLTSGFGSFDLTVTASVTDGGTATASSAPTTLHVEVSRLGAAAALHAAVLQSPAADSTLHVAGTTNLDASAGSTAVNSSSLPMDFHQGAPVDLTAQLDARFGAGSTPSTGGNPVLFKAGGPTTLGGTHTGDFITSVLEHAQHTAQLPVH